MGTFNWIKDAPIILLVTTAFFDVITLFLNLASLESRDDQWVSSDKKVIITMFILFVVIKAIGLYGLMKEQFCTISIFSIILLILWIVNLACLSHDVNGKAMNIINNILTFFCILFSLYFDYIILLAKCVCR